MEMGAPRRAALWPLPIVDLHSFKYSSPSLPIPIPTRSDPQSQEPQPQPISSPEPYPISLPIRLLQSLTSLLPFNRWNKPATVPSSSTNSPSSRLPPPYFRYESGCAVPLFRPYVARVPWHGGVRAFLSQLFPRYGHYCGPNWSSGKDGGSMLWDRRPIDWLDFCCYCHDIGYDTHDQAQLLKADLAFLQCLEQPRVATKGGAHLALLYRSMCITGLRHILIPYRMQLVRMQSGGQPPFMELLSSLIGAGRGNAYRKNTE